MIVTDSTTTGSSAEVVGVAVVGVVVGSDPEVDGFGFEPQLANPTSNIADKANIGNFFFIMFSSSKLPFNFSD